MAQSSGCCSSVSCRQPRDDNLLKGESESLSGSGTEGTSPNSERQTKIKNRDVTLGTYCLIQRGWILRADHEHVM
jgi:hypothetical protein